MTVPIKARRDTEEEHMVAYGVDMATLAQIAEETGVRLNEAAERGKGIKFTLRPTGDAFRKVNPISGRRVSAVCWHGHAEFFERLFTLRPTARVKSQCADYKGLDDYRAKYRASDTRLGPEGNMYHRWKQSDCCDC